MLHASIEALFGGNYRTRNLFQFNRGNKTTKDEHDELKKYFSTRPHLEKTIIHGSIFAFIAMQGWRSTMEDKHKHLIPLDNHSWKLWSYFSIFDGHNGKIYMHINI